MKKFSKNPYAIKERSTKASRLRRRLSTPDEGLVAHTVTGVPGRFGKVNEVVKWVGGWTGRSERSIVEDPDPDVRGDYWYVQDLLKVRVKTKEKVKTKDGKMKWKVEKPFVSVAQAVALSGWARECLSRFQAARKRNSALDSKMEAMDEQDKLNPTPGVRSGL